MCGPKDGFFPIVRLVHVLGRHLTCTISLNSHAALLLSLFYRWGRWGLEKLRILLSVIQLVSGKKCTRVLWLLFSAQLFCFLFAFRVPRFGLYAEVAGSVTGHYCHVSVILTKYTFLNATFQTPGCTYSYESFALRSILQNVEFHKERISVYFTSTFPKPGRALAYIKVIMQ